MRIRAFLLLLCIVVVTSAVPKSLLLRTEWEKYKTTHEKVYSNHEEDRQRMKTYLASRQRVSEHNKRYESGIVSYKIGLNQFSDMTDEEKLDYVSCLRQDDSISESHHTFIPPPAEVKIPDSFDWRTKGAVTPVKNQGICGACWAFSVTGTLEGRWFLKTGKLVALSEQNLIDCDPRDGCEGGQTRDALSFIAQEGGIDTEESYPYLGQNTITCNFSNETIGATEYGYVSVPVGDETALKGAIAIFGPISIGITAEMSLVDYKSGIYDDPGCGKTVKGLNHGVLAVGYGTENGKDYWLVKNSWGRKWGEEGYVKMARNKNNQCRIADMAIFPII